MSKILKKQLMKVEKKERRMMKKESISIPVIEELKGKVEEKTPEKLRETLSAAFYKGFVAVFDKGTGIIEKTFDKERLSAEHQTNAGLVKGVRPKSFLKEINKGARKSRSLGSGVAALEGTVLGALGIGLPDIPLFIAVLLKGIYEIALNYGFGYESKAERVYILKLIGAALSTGEERRRRSVELDLFGKELDQEKFGGDKGREAEPSFDQLLEESGRMAAEHLAEAMLTAKFIQGFPVVGIIGGISNLTVYRKICGFASMKYEKRFLEKSLKRDSEK